MSPLTEPDLKFSLIRLFRNTSSTFVQSISQMIYLRLWQWIKYEKTIELSPVIALLLAPPVYPLEGESHCVIIVALYSPRVTAHTIVLVMSKQLLHQHSPPDPQFYAISDTF